MTALSPTQTKVLEQILDWYEGLPSNWVHCNGATDCPGFPHTHGSGALAPVKSLGGAAGTGKTTLMRELGLQAGVNVVFGAPTHKASSVLRKKLPSKLAAEVRTYHSLVYQMTPSYRCTVTRKFASAVKAKCACGQPDACECPMSFLPCGAGAPHKCQITAELNQERRQHLGGHRDLIVIDESSMLSSQQVEDVRKFGVPILLVGDRRQLPPIKDPMNKWTLMPDWELTEIHRQGADSGILEAAYDVSRNGKMTRVSYGGGEKPDTVRLKKLDRRVGELLERFNPSVDGAIITYTNRQRGWFNRAYHTKLVGEGPVDVGDRVVALGGRPYEAARVRLEDGVPRATGEFIMVHNSMMGTVLKATHRGIVSDLTVQLDDHRLATSDDPVVILTGSVPTAQFGADKELPLNSPERPRGSHPWDYAYALTAHKAQGSEFPRVIIVDENPPAYASWMYTAITRAQEAAVVIDWRS